MSAPATRPPKFVSSSRHTEQARIINWIVTFCPHKGDPVFERADALIALKERIAEAVGAYDAGFHFPALANWADGKHPPSDVSIVFDFDARSRSSVTLTIDVLGDRPPRMTTSTRGRRIRKRADEIMRAYLLLS